MMMGPEPIIRTEWMDVSLGIAGCQTCGEQKYLVRLVIRRLLCYFLDGLRGLDLQHVANTIL